MNRSEKSLQTQDNGINKPVKVLLPKKQPRAAEFFTLKSLLFQLILLFNTVDSRGQICSQFDSAFGYKGRGGDWINNFQFQYEIIKMMVQSDQKIILLGSVRGDRGGSGIGLKRFTSDGLPDPAFGAGGSWHTLFGDVTYASSGILQNDQKVVVVGHTSENGKGYLAIARFETDGRLDLGFGQKGLVKSSYSLTFDQATSVLLQPDGKIIVSGNSFDEQNTSRFMLARYLSNGVIDSAFGSNGKVFTHLGPIVEFLGNQVYGHYAHDVSREVLLQTDGRIIVLGNSYTSCSDYDYYGGITCRNALGIVRYHSNGRLDSTFGNSGKILDDIFYNAKTAKLQPDGKILVLGSGIKGSIMTVRYHSNGQRDKSFGVDGIIGFITTPPNLFYTPSDLQITQNGKIMVIGNVSEDISKIIAIQYQNDGTPLDAFATHNSMAFHFGGRGSSNIALASGLQDNNLLIGGVLHDSLYSELLLFRLTGNLPKPEVKYNGAQLSTQSGYAHYQWFFNGLLIPGNDTSILKPSQNGMYKVKAINAEGCSATSVEFNHLVLASEDISIGKVKLRYYPNPVRDRLTIEVLESDGNKIQAELYELGGKLIHQQPLKPYHNYISTQYIPSGVYQMVLKSGKESKPARIMVIK